MYVGLDCIAPDGPTKLIGIVDLAGTKVYKECGVVSAISAMVSKAILDCGYPENRLGWVVAQGADQTW